MIWNFRVPTKSNIRSENKKKSSQQIRMKFDSMAVPVVEISRRLLLQRNRTYWIKTTLTCSLTILVITRRGGASSLLLVSVGFSSFSASIEVLFLFSPCPGRGVDISTLFVADIVDWRGVDLALRGYSCFRRCCLCSELLSLPSQQHSGSISCDIL